MGVAAIFKLDTPWSEDDIFDLGFEQSADVMIFTHLNHPIYRLNRYAHDNWTLNPAARGQSIGAIQDGDLAVTPIYGPNGPGSSADYVLTVYVYTVTAINDDTGQESGPASAKTANNDLTLKGNTNHLTWERPATATSFRVYKQVTAGGAFGFIGATDQLEFSDNNIAPDTSTSYPRFRDPFAAAGDYPAVVAFHEQRAMYGRTLNRPNAAWGSQSADFFNFNTTRPLQASDSLSFALVGRRVNAILHLVSLKALIAFTTDAVFSITGSGGGVLTPTDITPKVQGYRSASRVRPVGLDDMAFFCQARGGSIRTVGYQFETDGYKGNDLTVFAPHLFKRIAPADMTFAEYPNSALHVVRSDGKVNVLTWQAEQDVWGWAVHETDGVVESCATVSEDGEDRVYYIVRRLVAGVQRRYIERSASRLWEDVEDANYLDSSRVYAGPPATVLRGLGHLEGRRVSVLADGAAFLQSHTVADGRIVLARPASKVVVGLSYESWIRTLPLVLPAGGGSGRALTRAVAQAVISVLRSRGLEIATARDLPPGQENPVTSNDEIAVGGGVQLIEEAKTRNLERMGANTELYSGDLIASPETSDWRTASLIVRQRYPLPMHVIGIYPDVEPGG